MAVDWLITQRGTLMTASVKEIFVFTHAVKSEAAASSAGVATTAMNAIKSAFTAQAAYKSNIYSGVIFTEATAAPILGLTNGDLGAAAHVPYAPPIAGSGTGSLPTQNAIAVSLSGGAKPNGTPYRGRFYLPTPDKSSIGTDGLYAQANNTLLWVQAYLANLAAGTLIASIWSRKDGLLVPVNLVRVGNKVDTIRTRRNELPETYVQATVTREVNGEDVPVMTFEEARDGRWRVPFGSTSVQGVDDTE